MVQTNSKRMISRRERGSVLVLVVATLGLLAVIGTVYIVSARAERGNSTAAQVKANFDHAQEAVHNTIGHMITRSMTDAEGTPGGYYFNVAAGQRKSYQVARRYTIPELGAFYPDPGNTFFVEGTADNGIYPSERWLAGNTYRIQEGLITDPNYMNLSILGPIRPDGGGNRQIMAFNPRSGTYDLPYSGTFMPQFHITGDHAGVFGNRSTKLLSLHQLGSPVNVEVNFDALVQLLPFTDASGIRYRYGGRIIDSSRMANLNVGLAQDGSIRDTAGRAPNSYFLGSPLLIHGTDMANVGMLDHAILGRKQAVGFQIFHDTNATATYRPFDLADELELRSYGNMGTLFVPRPAFATLSNPADPTTVDPSRSVWPWTFYNKDGAGNVIGAARRQYYTTWSYSQQFRLWPSRTDARQRYALKTDGSNTNVVTDEAKTTLDDAETSQIKSGDVFSVSPDPIDVNTSVTGVGLAINATNLATTMRYAGFKGPTPLDPGGYTLPEVNAFFANYLTFRSNDWHSRTVGSTPVWSLISLKNATEGYGGPSYVDGNGFVYKGAITHDPTTGAVTDDTRAVPMNFGGTVTSVEGDVLPVVTSEAAGKRYIGYAAQPFINEVALSWLTTKDPSDTPIITLQEIAIELANPYEHALDLKDYVLKIDTEEIDLAKYTDKFIPAQGFFVLSNRSNTAADPTREFQPRIAAAAQHAEETTLASTGNVIHTIRLYRKYSDRTTQIARAEIDRYNTLARAIPAAPPAAPEESNVYYRRAGDPAKGTNWQWTPQAHTAFAEVEHPDPPLVPGTEQLTLGDINPAPTAPEVIPTLFPLIDRTLGNPGLQGVGFANPNEFNQVMRISHVVDPGTGDAVLMPYPLQLVSAADPEVAGTEYPRDASLHFDFRTPPWVYKTPAPGPDPTRAFLPADRSPASPFKGGDYRANYVLENLSFTGNGRVAGQININTAPFEVLCAIGPLDIMTNAQRAQWACAILAYRHRSISDGSDPRIPNSAAAPISGTVFDFRNQTIYPGYGIRSLGELEVALSYPHNATPTAPSLAARDQLWGAIVPICTVRSDTFVVYGYMDAVKQNPRYNGAAGPFNNSTDWYGTLFGTTSTEVTDDPNNVTAKLLRVGRRRWVALMDRSDGTPRVIAVKHLPQ